jgi:pterin-4a-carbinolamine dehydratase
METFRPDRAQRLNHHPLISVGDEFVIAVMLAPHSRSA